MTEDRVELTPSLLVEDALIFGVRMNDGVDLAALRARFPLAPWNDVADIIGRLGEAQLARMDGDQLRLTPQGRLLADSVGTELMHALTESLPHEGVVDPC